MEVTSASAGAAAAAPTAGHCGGDRLTNSYMQTPNHLSNIHPTQLQRNAASTMHCNLQWHNHSVIQDRARRVLLRLSAQFAQRTIPTA
jgi:hypothetical protein